MKLTHYISWRYIGVTVLVMLISIPVFYVVLQNVLTNNIDENLQDQKSIITTKLERLGKENFVNFQDAISIVKNPQKLQAEKLYTDEVFNKVDNEMESYRILQFSVKSPQNNYNVFVKQSLVESEDLLKTILYLLISILFILTLTLLLINVQIKQKIWKPFYKTVAELKNFRVDELKGLNLKKTAINEFRDLNESLIALAAVNQEVYKSQKEFTENASHELQTPLAILQNNVELLWQTETISKEQAGILDTISDATNRMSRLNKSLLLLSKIENKQYNEIQEVNMNSLVQDFFRNYQEQIKFKNIELQTQLADFFILKIDLSLAEILVGNLLLNALKYAPKNSIVEVFFTEKEMRISNATESLALDKNKLFKRFQRQSNQENSTGLGLEIARKIAVSFGLSLNYEFQKGRHYFILR